MRLPVPCAVVALAWFVLACGKGSEAAPPVPAAPANGSPIAAELLELVDAEDGRAAKLRLYNFGDRTAVSYVLLFRYYGADGALLKVSPGTPFESERDLMSISGRRYACKPKQHAVVEVGGLEVPAETARAEAIVTKVSSLASDGMTIEDWWSQERWDQWPASAPAPGN